MATYTDNYNLKMPSGQDAPNVEDFNGNAEILDKALDAHANNFADKYDPDSTYTQGDIRINNDALWKAKQNIDVAEPWTESHWESTNLAEVIASVYSSLNSRMLSGNGTSASIDIASKCGILVIGHSTISNRNGMYIFASSGAGAGTLTPVIAPESIIQVSLDGSNLNIAASGGSFMYRVYF